MSHNAKKSTILALRTLEKGQAAIHISKVSEVQPCEIISIQNIGTESARKLRSMFSVGKQGSRKCIKKIIQKDYMELLPLEVKHSFCP